MQYSRTKKQTTQQTTNGKVMVLEPHLVADYLKSFWSKILGGYVIKKKREKREISKAF